MFYGNMFKKQIDSFYQEGQQIQFSLITLSHPPSEQDLETVATSKTPTAQYYQVLSLVISISLLKRANNEHANYYETKMLCLQSA